MCYVPGAGPCFLSSAPALKRLQTLSDSFPPARAQHQEGPCQLRSQQRDKKAAPSPPQPRSKPGPGCVCASTGQRAPRGSLTPQPVTSLLGEHLPSFLLRLGFIRPGQSSGQSSQGRLSELVCAYPSTNTPTRERGDTSCSGLLQNQHLSGPAH